MKTMNQNDFTSKTAKLMRVFLMLSLAAVVGCSSSSEKSDDSDESEDSVPTPKSAPVESSSSPAPKHSPAPEAPDKPSSSAMNKALSDAVKSQSDEQIEQVASQMLSQNPKDTRALNALAMNHFRKGRVSAARMLLGRALESQPNSSELHNNKGVIELASHNDRDALAAFRKALELNSSNGSAAANVGAIYLKGRNYKKAATAFEVAYDSGLKDWKTKNNYAVALGGSGNPGKAQDLYQSILKEQPNNKEVMMNYAILLIDYLDKPKEGLDMINKLRFIGVPSESRTRIVELENKAQPKEKATETEE